MPAPNSLPPPSLSDRERGQFGIPQCPPRPAPGRQAKCHSWHESVPNRATAARQFGNSATHRRPFRPERRGWRDCCSAVALVACSQACVHRLMLFRQAAVWRQATGCENRQHDTGRQTENGEEPAATTNPFGAGPDGSQARSDQSQVGVTVSPGLKADLHQADYGHQRDQIPKPADEQIRTPPRCQTTPHETASSSARQPSTLTGSSAWRE